jgi:hypothetical protein
MTVRRERRNDPRIVGRLEHPSDERLPVPRLVGAQEAIIALFGGLLRCEHGEATEDQRASHARDNPVASADEPRSAAPMFGRVPD